MELRFSGMPWYFDILSFVVLGTIMAICVGFIPAFAWQDSVISRTPNLLSDKIAEWFWFGLTGAVIIGSYVLAFAVLAEWTD